jgi:hypothetical protein
LPLVCVGFGGEKDSMKFLKVEWTKKRGAIALFATAMIVTSFILGGYVATGNWNPWGNRHYYQTLNANFQACYTPVGGTPQCQTAHNTIFNASARYVEQTVEKGAATPALCTLSATCSFNFIAMSTNAVAPGVSMTSTGATNGQCGGAGTQGGTELTTGGFAAGAGTVTDFPATAGTGTTANTIVKTFTASVTTTVAQACLVNESTIDANRVNLAAATFTAITLQGTGDTIQITWTITWSWS